MYMFDDCSLFRCGIFLATGALAHSDGSTLAVGTRARAKDRQPAYLLPLHYSAIMRNIPRFGPTSD